MVRKSVLRIGIDWVDGSAADDCDRLIALAQDSPREVLDGILEFLELPDIQKGGKPNDLPTSFIFNFDIIVFTLAVDDITNGSWQSKHNWKNLLVPEGFSSDGVHLGTSVRTRIPLFEMTCRLLYQEFPHCLVCLCLPSIPQFPFVL